MKDLKTMLLHLQQKKKLNDFTKINLTMLNKILSFLANVPMRKYEGGYSASSYRSVLQFPSKAVTSNTKEGIVLNKVTKVPTLVMLDSLGEPVYKDEYPEDHNFTLAVPSLKLKDSMFAYKEEYMPLEDLWAFVRMQHIYPASSYLAITGKQTDNPRMSACCPFVLLAHKLHNGVKYSAWDRADSVLDILLPKELTGISALVDIPEFKPEDLRGFLELMSHTQKSNYPVGPQYRTLLKLSVAASRHFDMGMRESAGLTEAEQAFDSLPNSLRRIVLQTWIFTQKYRTSDLILDIKDWDNTPEDIWKDFVGFGTAGAFAPTGKKQFFSTGGW